MCAFCVFSTAGGGDKSSNFHVLLVATLSEERKDMCRHHDVQELIKAMQDGN